MMAYAAALRLVGSAQDRAFFPDVNLLPPSLLRRRVTLPFTWHTLVLGVLLSLYWFHAPMLAADGRNTLDAIAAVGCAFVLVNYTLVLVSLPYFERFKPVAAFGWFTRAA